MATDRVDKSWQTKGLAGYPVGAILGTLQHYGVTVDPESFKTLGAERFPLRIATEWQQGWKGTGQFSKFPFAAAAELFQRLLPDRLTPQAFSETLANLLNVLSQLMQGSANAKVGEAFEKVTALKARVPRKDGRADAGFVEEVFAPFPEKVLELFDEMAERLAKEGHDEDATGFVELEEFLFPEREIVAGAMVRAALGKKDEAEALLTARAADGNAPDEVRLLAVDGLIHLASHEQAREKGEALLAEAEKAENFHFALALGGRLAHVYEQKKDRPALEALEARMRRVSDAHAIAHPAHQH